MKKRVSNRKPSSLPFLVIQRTANPSYLRSQLEPGTSDHGEDRAVDVVQTRFGKGRLIHDADYLVRDVFMLHVDPVL